MEENMHSWFHDIKYEERFGTREVSSIKMRKMLIDTYDIVSVVNRGEKKEIFGEDEVLLLFLTCAIAFCR